MICKKFLPIVSAFATLQARHQERPHQERPRYTRNALPLPRASLLATCHTHTRAEQKENSTTPGETPRPGREAKRSNKAAHIFRAPGEEEEEEEEEEN